MQPIFALAIQTGTANDAQSALAAQSPACAGLIGLVRLTDILADDFSRPQALLNMLRPDQLVHFGLSPLPTAADAQYQSLDLPIVDPQAPGPQSYPLLWDKNFQDSYLFGVEKLVGFIEEEGFYDRLHGMRLCASVAFWNDMEFAMASTNPPPAAADYTQQWVDAGYTEAALTGAMQAIAGEMAEMLPGRQLSFPVLDPRTMTPGAGGDHGAYYQTLVDAVTAAAVGASVVPMDMTVTPDPIRGLSLAAAMRAGGWAMQAGIMQGRPDTDVVAAINNGRTHNPKWVELHPWQFSTAVEQLAQTA